MSETEGFTRREMLLRSGEAAAVLAVGGALASCGDNEPKHEVARTVRTETAPDPNGPGLEEILRPYGIEKQAELHDGPLTFVLYGDTSRMTEGYLPAQLKYLARQPLPAVSEKLRPAAEEFKKIAEQYRAGKLPEHRIHWVLETDPGTVLIPDKTGLKRVKGDPLVIAAKHDLDSYFDNNNDALIAIPFFPNESRVISLEGTPYPLNGTGLNTLFFNEELLNALQIIASDGPISTEQQELSRKITYLYLKRSFGIKPLPEQPGQKIPSVRV